LQIVLVGQPDLAARLASPKLRQFNQRIGARALLPTLQGNEIYDYVDYRLRAKGGDIKTLFTHGALKELSRASGGIPRRINVLGHNALFNAFAQGEPCVTAENMRDAAHDYDHLMVSKASLSAKMSASASKAMQSASAAQSFRQHQAKNASGGGTSGGAPSCDPIVRGGGGSRAQRGGHFRGALLARRRGSRNVAAATGARQYFRLRASIRVASSRQIQGANRCRAVSAAIHDQFESGNRAGAERDWSGAVQCSQPHRQD
jgi:hypothetical protein